MTFPIAVRGDEEEGDIAQAASRPTQLAEHVETGHAGHVHIAQDEVRALADFPNALYAIASDEGLKPFILQDFDQQFDRCRILLDAEDFWSNSHARTYWESDACGSSIGPLGTWPTVLSMRRRPRCASTIRSTTYSPRPAPLVPLLLSPR